MKQKIFSLLLGIIAGLAIFFLISVFFDVNTYITSLNQNKTFKTQSNNFSGTKSSEFRKMRGENRSGNRSFSGNKKNFSGDLNFNMTGKYNNINNFSGEKPLGIKRNYSSSQE